MDTELKMTLKEAGRLGIIKQVENRKISLRKASEEMERQPDSNQS